MVLIAVLFGALAGCIARPPEPTKGLLEIDAPPKWSGAARVGPATDNWIATFRDPRLTKLAHEVQANNFDLRRAAARFEQAAANARIAGASMYPHLATNFDGNRSQQAFIGFPFGGDASEGGPQSSMEDAGIIKSLSNNFGVSLDLSWEIDLWGRIRAGQSATIAEAQASRAELGGVQNSLAAQAAKAYFALLEADEQLALARQSVKSLKDSEDTIREQFALADQPASQLRVAMSQVATGEAAVEEAKQAKAAVARQLEILLGRYPKGTIAAGAKLPNVPKAPPAGIPSESLYRRADVIAAERRVAAANKRILEAKLAVLPSFSLTASGGTASEELREVLNTDFSVWSLAGNAVEPLFRGGEIKGNVELRKATEREVVANFQKVALTALSEVETALTAEDLLRKREEALRRSEALLRDAYAGALAEYRDGVGTILNILTTQQQLITRQSQVITLRRLRLENRVDLHLALGGIFNPKVKQD